MANITDPTAVNFCNTKVRPMADILSKHYWMAKSIVSIWNAQSLSSTILNTTDEIIDGARQDGRAVITGAKATAIITRCNEIITDYEATSNAKLNTVAQVAVNGT